MIDREKVIRGLEICRHRVISQENCKECPYIYDGRAKQSNCEGVLHWDAIALLKEQETVEQKTGHWIVLEFCANEGIYCSECHMKIFDRITKPKKKLSQYCPHCGSRNEQFIRDGEVVFR